MANVITAVCFDCKTEKQTYANGICRSCSAARARKYHQKNREQGHCVSCGGIRDRNDRVKCASCREREKKRYRERGITIAVCRKCEVEGEVYANNRYCRKCSAHLSTERRRRNRLNGYCSCGRKLATGDRFKCERCRDRKSRYNKERGRIKMAQWRECHKDRLELQRKERSLSQKMRIFKAYGGCVCACCGDTHLEFLTLNHLNGGGNKHRKEVKNLYRWIIRNNFPPGFNVLCMNCNFAEGKAEGGCPHKRERFDAPAKIISEAPAQEAVLIQ